MPRRKVLEHTVGDYVHNKRGIAYGKLGNDDLALDDYSEAIEFNPEFVDAYINRGWIYRQRGKYDLAVKDYAKAIELQPDDARAYNNRGSVYRAWGKYDLALADYTRAIELQPDWAELFNIRGECYAASLKYELALNDFDKAISLKPEEPAAYNNLAWILATCPDSRYRDAEKAVSNARQACKLSELDDFSLLDTLAAAYAEADEFAEAVQWQTKAIQLAPAGDKADLRSRLKLYQMGKPFRETSER